MAFLNKNTASVVSSSAAIDLQVVKDAVAAGKRVFKLELNANPTKVIAAQTKGQSLNTVTNLGGCGALRVARDNGRAFFYAESRIGKYDEANRFIVDTDFALNFSQVVFEETEEDKLLRATFAAKGKAVPAAALSSSLGEIKFNAEMQRHAFDAWFGTDLVNITFNDNGSLEHHIDSMRQNTGLLTVYFMMDTTHLQKVELDSRFKNEVGGKEKAFLKPEVLFCLFEEGKTVYSPKPKNVLSTDRIDAGIAAAMAVRDKTGLNTDGNKVLSDSFFEAIEIRQEISLAKIGTGKKAHLDAKKGLIAAVEAGLWDASFEAKLIYIAQRGLNVHYTMVDHDNLMSSLRKQLIAKIGDAAQTMMAPAIVAPVVADEPAKAETVIAESSLATAKEDEDLLADDVIVVSPAINPLDWLKGAQASTVEDEFGDLEI